MIQYESHVDVGQVDPEFLMRFGLGDSRVVSLTARCRSS